MLNFTNQAMFEIIATLQEKLEILTTKGIVEFEVLNPDTYSSTYSGNIVNVDEKEYIYRGYKAWLI